MLPHAELGQHPRITDNMGGLTWEYLSRVTTIEEWRLNTAAKVKEGDPDLYRLLTDPKYRFPTVLPDGKYMAKNSE